ncbi:hypothetical protein D9M72_222690 [compost metagenome]
MHELELRTAFDGARHRIAAHGLQLRREPVVQRDGAVLALDQQAFVDAREFVGHVQDRDEVGRALLLHAAFGIAALHAVLAGRGQPQRREKAVDGIDLAPRHHGERATEQVAQVAQQGHEGGRHLDGFRRGGEADQRAVEVEKKGGVPARRRWQLGVAAGGLWHWEKP